MYNQLALVTRWAVALVPTTLAPSWFSRSFRAKDAHLPGVFTKAAPSSERRDTTRRVLFFISSLASRRSASRRLLFGSPVNPVRGLFAQRASPLRAREKISDTESADHHYPNRPRSPLPNWIAITRLEKTAISMIGSSGKLDASLNRTYRARPSRLY